MATLRNARSRSVRPVAARLLVGRSPSATLRLDGRHVSGEHCTLIWNGEAWEVRDLGSRNGTFVDGKRLTPGEAVRVSRGAKLGFGELDDAWELADDGPPSAIAENLNDGALRTAEHGLLTLPDDDHPEVVVSGDSVGRWRIERDGDVESVKDGQVVLAGGASWRVRLPELQAGTATVNVAPTLDTVKLRFAVSRDEEHVAVTVVFRGDETRLEPREHWYTLLTLARQRLEDATEPPSEQGWIERDDLLRMLGTDSNGLNVAIYRARRQLDAAGVDGASALVEVRRGQRRIGLSVDRLEVVPL
jgi:hypothetical protein